MFIALEHLGPAGAQRGGLRGRRQLHLEAVAVMKVIAINTNSY